MKKKKNKFWLFVFSLWPGAGHMYIGFMKMGLSFMVGFLLSCAVVGITDVGALAVFPITIYVYAFFHANNIGGLDDEAFAAMEDEYLFGIADMDYSRLKLTEKSKSAAAVILIILGICMLWDVGIGMVREYVGWDNPVMQRIYYVMRYDVPKVILAFLVIWVGVRLLRGKRDVPVQTAELVQKEEKSAVQAAPASEKETVMETLQKDEEKEV